MTKTVWSIDPAHSEIGFSVKHMMISRVKGTFETFDATLVLDEDELTNSEAEIAIEVASINTAKKIGTAIFALLISLMRTIILTLHLKRKILQNKRQSI